MPVAYQVLGKFTEIVRHILRQAEVFKASVKDDLLVQIQEFGGVFPYTRNVMGNENDRHVFPAVKLIEDFKKILSRFRIERCCRLIENQQLRFIDNRPCNKDPLLLPAR